MFFEIRQSAGRCLAASLSLCLALASIGSSVAVACEGAGEEKGAVTFKPFESSEGKPGKCPKENAANEAVFKNTKEWCEYEVKNGSNEEVEVEEATIAAAKPGCEGFAEGKLCLEFAVAAQKPTCAVFKKLPKGTSCFNRLEYINEPAVEEGMKFKVKTKGIGAGKVVTPLEGKQKVR